MCYEGVWHDAHRSEESGNDVIRSHHGVFNNTLLDTYSVFKVIR